MSTTLSYPATLPAFRAEDCRRSGMTAMNRQPVETGPDRVEREFTTTPRFMQASTRLDQAGFDIFWDFFESTTVVGTLSFYVEVPGDAYSTGMEWWEAAFVDPPPHHFEEGTYLVNLNLRLITGPSSTNPAA
jgi:hypothetical protein